MSQFNLLGNLSQILDVAFLLSVSIVKHVGEKKNHIKAARNIMVRLYGDVFSDDL